jgi:hypothetical protein
MAAVTRGASEGKPRNVNGSHDLAAPFGLTPEDRNLDLGPLGQLSLDFAPTGGPTVQVR